MDALWPVSARSSRMFVIGINPPSGGSGGLLSYVSRRSFTPFAWYRIFFGVLILATCWGRSFYQAVQPITE